MKILFSTTAAIVLPRAAWFTWVFVASRRQVAAGPTSA